MQPKTTIYATCLSIKRGEALAITGASFQLGEWVHPLILNGKDFPHWTISVALKSDTEYKFVVVDRMTGKILRWEDGANRILRKEETEVRVRPDFSTQKAYRATGTAVPVFSLRSEESFGVGEFLDLKKLIDWAEATGQSIIQLLPINDTTSTGTWTDSYPYNAISSFALHPQFINLVECGVEKDEEYCKIQKDLNSLPRLDYESVNREKTRLLGKLYARKGEETRNSSEYLEFHKANEYWLKPYAEFCAQRDGLEPGFYEFVQFHLDRQLKEVVTYAHAHRVILKGDLPIGISRDSVDAKSHPELFNMDSQAGAPPDFFSRDGQNWGFPTYNWEEMAKDGYQWWKSRMKKMGEYFDAFRIDHILGFFRIWEIPIPEKSGTMGHFSPALPYSAEEIAEKELPVEGLFLEDPRKKDMYHPRINVKETESYARLDEGLRATMDSLYEDFFFHRHNAFWKGMASERLSEILRSTTMLACGEDLGMIPDCVPEVMRKQGILSLEIQRMPKAFGTEFGKPEEYPYECVCTTSTHDMAPIRAWWETADRNSIQRYYNNVLGRHGNAPLSCDESICEQIVRMHLESPAMLTILPLQDWMSMDTNIRYANPTEEQINDPANSRHYWRYRMHITLEELIKSNALNAKIYNLSAEAGL